MKKTHIVMAALASIMLAALLSCPLNPVFGANNVVGFNKITVPAASDALVSVPLTQKPVGTFTVSAVTGTGIQVTQSLTDDQYNTTYYVRITSGTGNGRWSTITDTASSNNELTVEKAAILTGISAGDTLQIIAHNTLDSLFPAADAGRAFEASPGATAGVRKTEVLLPSEAIATNKAASGTYYFISFTHPSLGLIQGWRLSGGSALTDVGSTIIKPDSFMILRNNSDSKELVFVSKGYAPATKLATWVNTEESQYDINFVSGRPYEVSLDQLKLESVFEASPGATAGVRKDELLVFNNSAAGQNKPASATYYYISFSHPSLGLIQGWRLSGGSALTDVGSIKIAPGSAMIIRKAAGTQDSQTYTQSAPY